MTIVAVNMGLDSCIAHIPADCMDLWVNPDGEPRSVGIYKVTVRRRLKTSDLKAHTKKNIFRAGLSLHC